ncbi:MAG: SPOR domain-containing protein [Mariniphaga sp.]
MDQSVALIYPINRKNNFISGFLLRLLCLIVLYCSHPLLGMAQDEPIYDEISVFFNVQQVGGADITAVIRDETVYLPIMEIFSFLKIKNVLSSQMDSVTGFFINQQATYLIDKVNNRITYQGKIFDLKKDDLIKTETNLYLRSPIFGQVFGLNCVFNFRSLSVALNTKIELPIIRELRQEQMRSNISRLKGEIKTDTTIERKYPMFHFGMADWSMISTQQLGGKVDARFNLALGSVIAGGETNVSLNISNNSPFTEKQQQYYWRSVNNDRPALRQVLVGKIGAQSIASLYDPVIGIQLTNSPTTYRRSFGTYTLSDITEPNWIVELYVNNVLVDYMKADASGFYKFEVPLVYGNSAVKLRFYGPWGEERVKEENLSIPFNFLPPKELEYTLSAGVVEDTLISKFSRLAINYGVSRRLTFGGGVEYLSTIKTGTTLPYISSSLRLMSSLLLTGEYTYGVRTKGILNYRLPSNLQIELNYTKYHRGQTAIVYNYLEERKAVVSLPIKGKNFAAYSRVTVNQIILPNLKNTNAEMLWSGSVYGVSTNLTTYGLFNDVSKPYLYSNLSLSFKLPWRTSFTPQAQYEYNTNQLMSVKGSLEKPLFKKGFFNMSYEQNFRNSARNIEFGFRYDLTFAQAGFSIRNSNDLTSLVESARGSLLYDQKSKYIGTNNRTSVGKGDIILRPFLDANGNEKYDLGEVKVQGLQFKINGGTIVRRDRDTTIQILDLTPYSSYLLEFDKNSFDNISWQLDKLSYKVMIDPNQFKIIDVPISVMGEASGTVYNGSNGQGRILVCIYRSDLSLVTRMLTESDGYYSYLGLKPGKYTVRIDPAQLAKLKIMSTPEFLPVTISGSIDGDIIDGLDFRLKMLTDTTTYVAQSKSLPLIDVLKKNVVKPSVPENIPIKSRDSISSLAQNGKNIIDLSKVKMTVVDMHGTFIQFGAYKTRDYAVQARAKIEQLTGLLTWIIYEGEYYKIAVSGFSNIKEATLFAAKLEGIGISIYFITTIKPNICLRVEEFEKEVDALNYKEKLSSQTGKPCMILFKDDRYLVLITGFSNTKSALNYVSGLGVTK